MLRGTELCQPFEIAADGDLRPGTRERLTPGQVTAVSPRLGDVHRVSNAHDDRVSISIHVYGANIGAVGRHVYDAETGAPKDFVSGYSSPMTPNLWDRAAEVRAGLASP
jgi:predicted metal-dependent enzyme (double-stranded beta helix superfamily)